MQDLYARSTEISPSILQARRPEAAERPASSNGFKKVLKVLKALHPTREEAITLRRNGR
jgi:hypothetical protein